MSSDLPQTPPEDASAYSRENASYQHRRGWAGMSSGGRMMVVVAIAVVTFISCGGRTEPFAYLEKDPIAPDADVLQLARSLQDEQRPQRTRLNAIATCLCILSAMPLFLGLVMTLVKPGMMIPYLTSAFGLFSILAMCVLIFVGWLMIRKIIRIDV